MAPQTAIEFSAQFGGRDAAGTVLTHFRALKEASKGIVIPGLPFEKLAFILRVDGDVSCYGISGIGSVGRDGVDYLSVDLGIPRSVTRGGADAIATHILWLLDQVTVTLTEHSVSQHIEFEAEVMHAAMTVLACRYRDASMMAGRSTSEIETRP